jgi:hypothetical protein
MADLPADDDKRRRRWALAVLVPATVIYLLSLPLGVAAALMAPMAFDSGQSPAAWAYLAGSLAYLFLVVTALISAWLLFRRARYRAAMLVLLLPPLGTPVVAGAAAVALGR